MTLDPAELIAAIRQAVALLETGQTQAARDTLRRAVNCEKSAVVLPRLPRPPPAHD
ncbi:MAG: hypothetical protein ACK4Y5_19040 [Acetobacteraceae bacterium]|jgi:hypothetical protein